LAANLSEQEKDTYSFNRNDEKEVEEFVGIKSYVTRNFIGIGGIYKEKFKDFIVKEILKNDKTLSIKEDYKSSQFSEELKDRFTTFNLIKVNRDTFEALRLIRKNLNVPYDWIKHSGLKDKFSISVQKISVRGNHIDKLRKLRIKDIFIRNIQPSKKPVKMGSHKGNNFTIVLRNIDNIENLKERVESYIENLNKFGFPNYFGLQRFGNYRPNSHKVGSFLMAGNFEKAYKEFVLTTYSTESSESRTVRSALRINNNLEEAYNNFPKSLNYERNMIYHLIENPGDYKGSINTLPSSLKQLLISSYQSFLFNKMLSLRLEKGISAFNPIKGDVISILDDYNGNITQVKYIYGGVYDKFLKRAIELDRASIVIPIIGFKTKLNQFPLMKTLFEEIKEEENIDETIFKSEFMEEPEFKGSIRAITMKPIGLKMIEFDDDDLYPGKKKIKLEFSLLKGCYATMLIRELIK
jgi:tRNA pseudouridine13 synthase